MSPERWKQIEEVFQAALDLPEGERTGYISATCAGDAELRAQVEALVAQHDEAGDFIETPAVAVSSLRAAADAHATNPMTGAFDDPAIGRRLGAYKIVRELGRGGMGAVYMAERADSEFRRSVAIKLIKRGMDTDFILRRFRNERQILATLDHPHIAKLLDGGTTEEGLPYFVMEFIEGQPVYQYCDERRLNVAERLRLFAQVCDAVHYAHRTHVIHRDIKPSNIMVTPAGVPKLLDFGIAKVLNPEMAADITLDPTGTAMLLMTPEYAAPEQVCGQLITPATDVYSLGVLLYELLTGHRPYRLVQRSPHEIARVICEDEPAPPSIVVAQHDGLLDTRPRANNGNDGTLKQVLKHRRATVESLSRQLAGDLDGIIMKALSKEPERRYQSAEQLRDDILSHLEGRSIAAPLHSPAAARAAHPAPDFTPGEISLAVLPLKLLDARRSGGAAGDEYLGIGLADALITRLSNVRRLVVRPTSSVVGYQGDSVDPFAAGLELGAAFVLDGRIRRASDSIRVTVQLLDARAGTTVWAGQFDEKFTDVLRLEDAIASQVAESIIPRLTGEERRQLSKRGTDNAEAYEAYLRGRFYWNSFGGDSYAKALASYQHAVALDPNYAHAYAALADYYNMLGVYSALPFAEASAKAKEAALKSVALDDSLAEGYSALGYATLTHDFDWRAAEDHLRRAVELNPNYATGQLWYGYYFALAGRFDNALVYSRRALALDPLSPVLHHTAHWIYYLARRYDEAIAAASGSASDDPQSALAYVVLCLCYSQVGRHDEAVESGRKAVAALGRSPYTLARLASALARAGRKAEARAMLKEMEAMSGARHVSRNLVATVLCHLGETDAAFAEFATALAERDARLIWMGVDPQFDPLRDDPRFENLLRRTHNPAPRPDRRQTGDLSSGGERIASERATGERSTGERSAGERATGEPQAGEKSVAVLPLKVLAHAAAEDTGDEYLGVGLADALVARLSAVRRFVVRPTSSVLRYGGDVDPLEAGRALGVDYVVTGTIRRAGNSIRVSAQLLDVREGATRWARKFDAKSGDVLHLEDTLSEQVATALVPQLTGEEQRELQKRGTESPEAYEAYLRGRFYWNTFTEEGFAKALISYSRAIAIDPTYAAPYGGIADYYNWLGVYGVMPFAECSAAAKEAARKAVELDPTSAEAYTALGFATVTHDFDWTSAARQHLRAIELNPKYATAHQWYGFHLTMEARFDEAVSEMLRARSLDPLTPSIMQALGWCYYEARRFDDALTTYRRLLDIEPNFAYGLATYAWALRNVGEHEEAVRTAQKSVAISGGGQFFLTVLAASYAAAGRDAEARAVLEQLDEMARTRYVSPYHLAITHLRLNDRERALALLEEAQATGDGWLVWIGVEPELDPLRADPRFENLLRRTNNPTSARRDATRATSSADATSALAPATAKPRTSDDEEARQLYQAARYFATRRTAEGLRQAIERLERAVERDPKFALAHAELADCNALLNWYVEPPPADAWARAKKSALDAVAADDQLPVAHASLGFVMCHYDRDWAGAETELRRAVELDPENPVARRWHAFNLSAMGRHEDALAEIRLAQELSPRSPVIATGVANILFLARRFDEAAEQCRKALELDPGSVAAHVVMRWAYEKKGLREEALAVYEQERAFAGDTPTTRAKRAHVLAACGRRDEAREILRGLLERRDDEWVTAYELAIVHALLGDHDGAFRWLARAEGEHAVGFAFVAVDPHLDALHDDPRFRDLLRRLGSPAT
jgi:serine/threonine protein kinase/TolB-like protein/Tfp pilus assembly protein PilF